LSNSIIFLRHAETNIDPSLPAHVWSISEEGIRKTQELAKSAVFAEVAGIVHSSEKKARQTADVFAELLRVDLYELPEFDELRRQAGPLLSSREYRLHVRATLTDWEHSHHGWESGRNALQRFSEGVKRINIMFYDKTILVVSHGIVMSLYFSQLRNLQSIAFERWAQMPFLAWGLVREDQVLIDII
jgi:broad specificity phosphatase PhoE